MFWLESQQFNETTERQRKHNRPFFAFAWDEFGTSDAFCKSRNVKETSTERICIVDLATNHIAVPTPSSGLGELLTILSVLQFFVAVFPR